MKKIFAVLCLFLLILPLPGLLGAPVNWLGENRDEDVTAHWGFRDEMTSLHAALSRRIGMSGSNQVTLGKNGTLFLSETLAEAVGAEGLTDEETEAIAQLIAQWDAELRAKGARLIFLCAPNKANMQAEDLPYYALHRAGDSALDKLQRRLGEKGVAFVDAKALLKKSPGPAYLRTDTHWTDASARAVDGALMEMLGLPAWSAAETETVEVTGDLAELTDPVHPPREQTTRAVLPRAYRVQGVMRSVMDMRIDTVCGVNDLRVIMLRDSFANALFPYLANQIGHLRLIRADRWEDAMWMEGTDAVILEIAERNIRNLLNH